MFYVCEITRCDSHSYIEQLHPISMNKTGKRVDVVRAKNDHDRYYDNGLPALYQGSRESVRVMKKKVLSYTPLCHEEDCEHVYRYDDHGDQICVNCGDIRNQRPALSITRNGAGREIENHPEGF